MLQNTELKNILTQKGYQFNEEGNLLLDDMANKTTSLDLSGTGISVDALSELSILPNLTDVDLSDNGYTMSFDFTKLPAQITGVDLTGNELYEYPGLLNIVTQENGDEDVTVLRNLTKLYLPESAKYNCNEIPTYFATVSGVDMQMANASGSLETYSTLREIPDDALRAYLKENFSALFDSENTECINITKRFVKAGEESENLMLMASLGVKNLDGVQYVLMNPSYQGACIALRAAESYTLPYLKIRPTIYTLLLSKVNTKYIDLTEATSLITINIRYNNTIETLDLSNSTYFGQRGSSEDIGGSIPTMLTMRDCDNLKEIIFPEKAKYASQLYLSDLASLEKVDLSSFCGFATLSLGRLGSLQTLKFYTPDNWYGHMTSGEMGLILKVATDIEERQETQTFLKQYGEHISKWSL